MRFQLKQSAFYEAHGCVALPTQPIKGELDKIFDAPYKTYNKQRKR